MGLMIAFCPPSPAQPITKAATNQRLPRRTKIDLGNITRSLPNRTCAEADKYRLRDDFVAKGAADESRLFNFLDGTKAVRTPFRISFRVAKLRDELAEAGAPDADFEAAEA